jgi:hypothetical protein
MKLNFWQWLGVVLLVVGVLWTLSKRRGEKPSPPPADLPAATAPSPAPR